MAELTKERLLRALQEKYKEEKEGVESYKMLSSAVFSSPFTLPKELRREVLDELYTIEAQEEVHRDTLKGLMTKLKGYL